MQNQEYPEELFNKKSEIKSHQSVFLDRNPISKIMPVMLLLPVLTIASSIYFMEDKPHSFFHKCNRGYHWGSLWW